MSGIDFIDTIVVRRTVEKGTKIIQETRTKQNWAGESFKKYQKKSIELAGDPVLSSSKGTQKIYLSKLKETQIPSLSGHHISTGRGTGFRVG